MIGLAVLTDRWNSDTRSRACMGWWNQIATLSNAYNFRFDWYVYVVINLSMSVVAAFPAAACVVRFTWWIHEVCTCCGIWSECRVRLDLFIAVVKLCVRWRLWLSYVPACRSDVDRLCVGRCTLPGRPASRSPAPGHRSSTFHWSTFRRADQTDRLLLDTTPSSSSHAVSQSYLGYARVSISSPTSHQPALSFSL